MSFFPNFSRNTLALAIAATFGIGNAVAADCSTTVSATTVISTDCSVEASGTISWTAGNLRVESSTISGSAVPQILQSGSAEELRVSDASIGSVKITGSLISVDAITLNNSTIGQLVITGNLGTDDGDGTVRLENSTVISELQNLGSISPGFNIGIKLFAGSSIGTLLNAQGGGTPLVVAGVLPNKYITFFSDPATFGKVDFEDLESYTLNAYGVQIASGQNWASGTYEDVIKSDQALTISSFETVSGVSYQLLTRDGGLTWDLIINAVSPSRVSDATRGLRNEPAVAAASVIDGSAVLLASFAGLTTEQQLSDATSQTLPLLVGGSQLVALNALSGINRVVLARLDANRGLSAGDAFFGDRHFWLKPFGSRADQSNEGGVAGFKANTGGMALGLDGSLSETLKAGLAFAWANSSVKGRSVVAPNSASVDVYQLVGYGTKALPNGSELNFQVDFGRNNNKGSRTLAFTNAVAQSKFNTIAFHAGGGWGKAIPLSDKTTYTPSIRLDYTRLRDESYTETGAGLFNLNVAARTMSQLILGGDVRFNHQISPSTQLSVNAGLGYDFHGKTASVNSIFAGAPGASFATNGIRAEPWTLRAGMGLVHTTQRGTEITSRLDVDKRSGFRNATASVNARWSF
jgi:outer membrane autotransporter protein